MTNRIALVTGANTGIGLETARGLAEAGMAVVMTARTRSKGEAAVADVQASTGSDAVELLDLDLSSLENVRAAAAEFLSRYDRLDLLVNNAGLIMDERRLTQDGFEVTFGVNHLGPYLLTELLLDALKAGAPSRIVNVASGAHVASRGLDFEDLMYERRKYTAMKAYGDSKLANILHALELSGRLEGTGVSTYAVHPGAVGTNFGQDGDTSGIFPALFRFARPLLRTPAKGAATSLYVATSDEVADQSGDYYANRKRKRASRSARDVAAAERLHAVSAALVGR